MGVGRNGVDRVHDRREREIKQQHEERRKKVKGIKDRLKRK
jgi:hypothetical protein